MFQCPAQGQRRFLLSFCASTLSQRVRWPAAYLEDGLPCCEEKTETQGHSQAPTAVRGIYLRHQCEFTFSLHAPWCLCTSSTPNPQYSPPPPQKQTGSESLQNKSQPSIEARVLHFQAHS